MNAKEKGISLVALVVTIVVILILSGTLLYAGMGVIHSAELESIKTDLLLIQAKTKTITEKADFEGNEEGFIGNALDEATANKIGFDGNRAKARILKQEQLDSLGLNKVKEKEGYVVDYEKEEIYYIQGVESKEGQLQYKLSVIEEIKQ